MATVIVFASTSAKNNKGEVTKKKKKMLGLLHKNIEYLTENPTKSLEICAKIHKQNRSTDKTEQEVIV